MAHVPASPEGPLLLGANRDEDYGRPSADPGPLAEGPRVWGGRDLLSGGTWLCARLDPPCRIVAVLNRPERPGIDPHAAALAREARRSRGLLCLEAARAATLALAEAEAARQVEVYGSAPFNLCLAGAGVVRVIAYDGHALRATSLSPGWHALTHGDPDDAADPRVAQALAAVADAPPSLDLLASVLVRDDGPGAACRHGERYGTVSSTLIEARLEYCAVRWAYTSGPPCRTPFSPAVEIGSP